MFQKTKFLTKEEGLKQRKWYIIDAKGKVLGRLASKIAVILQGKHKPNYTPHEICGDFVIVINAKDVVLTGKKWKQKKLVWHTPYPGGLKEIPYEKLREEKPERIIWEAVYGMLPKNFLRKRMIKMLKIYPGPEHKHHPQNPIPLDF